MNVVRVIVVPMYEERRKFAADFAVMAVALALLWEPIFWLGCGATKWCNYFFHHSVRVMHLQECLAILPFSRGRLGDKALMYLLPEPFTSPALGC